MATNRHLFQIVLDGTNTYYGVVKNWTSFFPAISHNERYRTNLAAFSLDKLEFVKEAKTYLDARYLESVAREVTIDINILSNTTMEYEDYLSGTIDLTQYAKTIDAKGVEITSVGLQPEGLVVKWLARDETEVELQTLTDMDGNAITTFTDETHDISLSTMIINKNWGGEFVSDSYQTVTRSQIPLVSDDIYCQFTPPEKNQDNDLNFQNFAIPLAILDKNVVPTANYEFNETGAVVLTMDSKVKLTVGPTDQAGTCELIIQFDGGAEIVLDTTNISASASTEDYDLTYTDTYNFVAFIGTQVSLFYKITGLNKSSGGGSSTFIEYIFDFYQASPSYYFEFDISQDSTFPTTTCKVMPPWEVFLRLLQKITGRNDPLRSSLYGRTDGEVTTYGADGDGALRMFTTGKLVRQFPLADNPMIIDFYKAFQIYNAIDNIGVGVEEISGTKYIVIEKIEYFYQTGTPAFTITDPAERMVEPALQYLFSEVRAGNSKYEKRETGTLQSPHTPRNFVTQLNSTYKNVLDIQGPAVFSGYLLEGTRREAYIDANTKDGQYDDDFFIIDCKRSGMDFVPIRDDDFTSITGIPDTTLQYNLNLSPVRLMIKRHLNTILVSHQRVSGTPKLRFQSGKGNVAMTTQKTGEASAIDEGADVSDTVDPLFLPDMITDTHPINTAQMKALLANPNTTITEVFRGTTKEHHIMGVKIEDINSKKAVFNLVPIFE